MAAPMHRDTAREKVLNNSNLLQETEKTLGSSGLSAKRILISVSVVSRHGCCRKCTIIQKNIINTKRVYFSLMFVHALYYSI